MCPSGKNPGIYFDTYDVATGNKSIGKTIAIKFEDFDGVWNFYYLSYSLKFNKLVFYCKFGQSGDEVYEELTATHFNPPGALRFSVGPGYQPPAIGYYFGLNFGINEGIFLENQGAVVKYFQKQGKPPGYVAPYTLVGVLEEYSYQMYEPDTDVNEYTEIAQNAMEYSVFGHFKWTPPKDRATWHLLFRMSSSDRDITQNMNSLGDRDLAVFLHSSNMLQFNTYDFAANSNVAMTVNVQFDIAQFANKWVWIYFGYSSALGKAVYYFKLENSEFKGEIKCNHFLLGNAQLRIGKDEWFSAWNGDVKHIHIAFGPGSYREDKYNELMALKVKQSAEEEAAQGIPEFNFGDKAPTPSSLFNTVPITEHVFDMEKLSGTLDYSWSAYYKQSWRSPAVLPLDVARNVRTYIGGITRVAGGIDQITTLADATLLASVEPLSSFTGYKLCTYNQDNKILADCQDVQHSSFNEYELGWTWFYMAYSTRRQKGYAVVYTPSST